MNVLIVDDQWPDRKNLLRCMSSAGINCEFFESGSREEALQLAAQHAIDVALIDLRLSKVDPANRDGLLLVREFREHGGIIPIVVTVSAEMLEVRRAMQAGAYTYFLKDELCPELVAPVLVEVQGKLALERQVLQLHGLVGASSAMEQLRQTIKKVAAADGPVLVLGPTGSGKELVARAIHTLSMRRSRPFVAINCGALAESLIEDQLFGHSRGAFTGAERSQEGILAEAKGGTLLLDEIAELPQSLQSKLLRVLENRSFRVLGANRDSTFEGRVLAATHVDLTSRIQSGGFREDLYYRLEVLTVPVPSLDQRKEDIPTLISHFVGEHPKRIRFSEDAMMLLRTYSWPGNVRQLRNLVYRIATFSEHELQTADDVRLYGGISYFACPSALAQSAAPTALRGLEAEMLQGISPYQSRKLNWQRLAQHQVSYLERQGLSPQECCAVMGIGRATFYRIKTGLDLGSAHASGEES